MKKDTKILISGGGIAGCTLAYYLKQYGYKTVIVESSPEFKRVGHMLALSYQIGQVVAQKMGILEKLKRFEMPLTKNTMYDMYGRLILKFELDYNEQNKRVGLILNRADLHLTLYDLVKDAVDFRFGQEISSVSEQDNGLDITFSNGQRETFDLVIGADGVHSNTRRLVFGEGFEKHLSRAAYFAFTVQNKTTRDIAGEHEVVSVRGNQFSIAYHLLSQNEVAGYVMHVEEPSEQLAPRDRRSYMLNRYGSFDTNFRHILETMTDDDFIFHDTFMKVVMPAWYKGRVCLTGDAAYCPTPAAGSGASLAMAGAYILAKNLSDSDNYQTAFADYDSYMRPYIKKIQKGATSMANYAVGKNFISYKFTNGLLRLLPVSIVTRLHSHAFKLPLP